MPRFKITAPDGREVTVEGATAPTEAQANDIFAALPPPRRALDIMGMDTKLARERAQLKSEAGRKELVASSGGGNTGILADILMEGGGATAGQLIGAIPALSVPTLGASVPIGGALGGIVGNLGAQRRRMVAGEQEGFKLGELLGTALVSAIPGAAVEGAGMKALAKEGGKQALGGLVGKTVETTIDESRLPSSGEVLASTTIPALGGAAAQKLGTKGADTLNPSKRATFEAGRKEGLLVTPSSISDSSINRRIESVAGKAAIGQAASKKNQETVTRLAKEAIGVPEKTDITEAVLDTIRREEAKPYEEIRAMAEKAQKGASDLRSATSRSSAHETEALRAIPETAENLRSLEIQAAADIDELRKARDVAKRNYLHYEKTGTPSALDAAEAADALAAQLEDKIEKAAAEFGTPELVSRLRSARTRIAKTYDVENALNLGDSQVAARILARALNKGRPLSGELENIAKFTEAFPSVMREGATIPTPGVSKVEAGLAALLAAGGMGATQSPIGAAFGALPLLSGPARALVLSKPYQRMLTAEPFALPKTAAGTRLVAQAAGQEVARETESDSTTLESEDNALRKLSTVDRAKAIDDRLRTLPADEQLPYWKRLTEGDNPVADSAVRAEITRLQGGGSANTPDETRTLTPAEAKDAEPGTFRGTNGKTYEKLPNGKIQLKPAR